MIYRVINFRYMRENGLVRALRFSRTFKDLYQALAYVNSKDNWYDLRVIAESEELKDGDRDNSL